MAVFKFGGGDFSLSDGIGAYFSISVDWDGQIQGCVGCGVVAREISGFGATQRYLRGMAESGEAG